MQCVTAEKMNGCWMEGHVNCEQMNGGNLNVDWWEKLAAGSV